MLSGILLPDGSPMSDNIVKVEIFGYQIVHKQTNCLLPDTEKRQIYSMSAAIKKMNEVAAKYTMMASQLDIFDYDLIPIYDFEIPTEYLYIMDDEDFLY